MSSAQLQNVADDLNTVAAFLAENDFPGNQVTVESLRAALGAAPADVLVLLGNSVLGVSERAFTAMQEGAANHLLIAGGRGHSTHFLCESLSRHPTYNSIATENRAEAELLAEMAVRFHGIDPGKIVLETESSNCGENAQFTLRKLLEYNLGSILLVQDPTMQRRSCASFRKAWQDAGLRLSIGNWPTFVPRVRVESGAISFEGSKLCGIWPMERFVSLVLGEVPRLLDNERGYGPEGRGYIVHVDVPQEVLAAHERLASKFAHLQR